jgi:hypothetical protein
MYTIFTIYARPRIIPGLAMKTEHIRKDLDVIIYNKVLFVSVAVVIM